MRPRPARPILALCLAALSQMGCAGLGEVRGPFAGRIIDEDTGAPIAGVVVLAVWQTLAFTPLGHGGQAFYDTREAISDSDGRFTIPRLPVPLGRTDVEPPRLYFFAPGYVLAGPNAFPVPIYALADRLGSEAAAYVVSPSTGQRFVAPTVVRMRPTRTAEEWCRYARALPPLVHSMSAKMPLTLDAIEAEKKTRRPCR